MNTSIFDFFENENAKYGVGEYYPNGEWKRVVVEPKYERIYDLSYLDNSGTAIVKEDTKYFLINLEDCRLSDYYEDMKHFEDGLCGVKSDNKWGYINEKGEIVIKTMFENAGSFYDGVAIVSHKGLKWLIDKNGNFLTEEGYDSILPEDDISRRFIGVLNGVEHNIYLKSLT